MSYDVWIIIGHDDGTEQYDRIGGYTSNVAAMYKRVLPGPYKGGGRYDGTGESKPRGGLPGLSGLGCWIAGPILTLAIASMGRDEQAMRKLDPPNGWGDYDGAFAFLQKIRDACERHRSGTVAMNW